MKVLQIVKKYKNLSPAEEKAMADTLSASPQAIKIITDYLEQKIVALDNLLCNPKELYSNGLSDTYVAFRLAERATYLKLHNVLTTEK